MASIIWFLWFYVWGKLKILLEPLPEIDEEFVQEAIRSNLEAHVKYINQDSTMSQEEKTEAIADVEYTYRKEFGDEQEILSKDLRENILKDVKDQRVLDIIILTVDSILMLLPSILIYNGYFMLSQIAFVTLGLIGSMTVEKNLGQESKGLISGLAIVGTFILTQIPYLAAIVVTRL